jgi:hypothetical protein
MALTLDEIYSIKCTIGRTLFYARPDWENGINLELSIYDSSKNPYLRFRMASASVTLDNKNMVFVSCTDGSKPIKFKHESIEATNERIAAQLRAHIGDTI